MYVMANWFETADRLLNYERSADALPRHNENLDQLAGLAKRVASGTLEAADKVTLPSAGEKGGSP